MVEAARSEDKRAIARQGPERRQAALEAPASDWVAPAVAPAAAPYARTRMAALTQPGMAAYRVQWAQRLQRTIGNNAVGALIAAAPRASAPSPASSSSLGSPQLPRVQRIGASERLALERDYGADAVGAALAWFRQQNIWPPVSIPRPHLVHRLEMRRLVDQSGEEAVRAALAQFKRARRGRDADLADAADLADVRQELAGSGSTGAGGRQPLTAAIASSLAKEHGREAVRWALRALGQEPDQADSGDVLRKIKEYTHTPAGTKLGHTQNDESAFEYWRKRGDDPAKMNCWEYVIYTAERLGHLSRTEVHAAYEEPGATSEVPGLFADQDQPIDDPSSARLTPGDAVVVGVPERHVMLSLGGDAVAELGNERTVQITTLAVALRSHKNDVRWHLGHFLTRLSPLLAQQKAASEPDPGSGSRLVQSVISDAKFRPTYDLYRELQAIYDSGAAPPFRSVADLKALVDERLKNASIYAELQPTLESLLSRMENLRLYRVPAASWIRNLRALIPAAGSVAAQS